MTKIRMITTSAGPEGCRPSGWEDDVDDKEARDLIAGGFAVAVKPPAATATKPKTAEKATRPKGEKRG